MWTLAEEQRITGLVSVVSFTNIFYLIRKLADLRTARRMMILLRDAFLVAPCDSRILNRAIDSDFRDFEDAVQYFSAVQAEADCLVTRNPDDFPRTNDCPVLTPAEFLATHTFRQ